MVVGGLYVDLSRIYLIKWSPKNLDATSSAATERTTSSASTSAARITTSAARISTSGASEATSEATSAAVFLSSRAGEVNSDVSAIEFVSRQINSLFSSFSGAEFDVSETSWLAIITSGDSDVSDITTAVEQLSKAAFGGGVAEVSDEDLSGGISLVLLSGGASTGASFLLRSGLFDGQGSALEFVAIEGQSLLEGLFRGELDKGDTL